MSEDNQVDALMERLTDTAMAVIAQTVMIEVPDIVPGALFANVVLSRLMARCRALQDDGMAVILTGALAKENLPWRLTRSRHPVTDPHNNMAGG
jgi:hypothetical protein